MISFIVCLLLLITGYLTYGKIVDKTFGPDDRETPAVRINDGVDYVFVRPYRKVFTFPVRSSHEFRAACSTSRACFP